MTVAWEKVALGALALCFLGIAGTPPARAQNVPQGSYLQSCGRAYVRGDTLIAICRRVDGYEQQTSLASVSRCVGDIGNNNGTLTCNYGGGAPRRGGREPYYGGRQPDNRGPQPGYDREPGQRCEALRFEVERLRQRLEGASYPGERRQLRVRLRQAEEQAETCRR